MPLCGFSRTFSNPRVARAYRTASEYRSVCGRSSVGWTSAYSTMDAPKGLPVESGNIFGCCGRWPHANLAMAQRSRLSVGRGSMPPCCSRRSFRYAKMAQSKWLSLGRTHVHTYSCIWQLKNYPLGRAEWVSPRIIPFPFFGKK